MNNRISSAFFTPNVAALKLCRGRRNIEYQARDKRHQRWTTHKKIVCCFSVV